MDSAVAQTMRPEQRPVRRRRWLRVKLRKDWRASHYYFYHETLAPNPRRHTESFMHFTWTVLVAGMLAICFLASGQEPGKGQKKDQQERFEPKGAPGAG